MKSNDTLRLSIFLVITTLYIISLVTIISVKNILPSEWQFYFGIILASFFFIIGLIGFIISGIEGVEEMKEELENKLTHGEIILLGLCDI